MLFFKINCPMKCHKHPNFKETPELPLSFGNTEKGFKNHLFKNIELQNLILEENIPLKANFKLSVLSVGRPNFENNPQDQVPNSIFQDALSEDTLFSSNEINFLHKEIKRSYKSNNKIMSNNKCIRTDNLNKICTNNGNIINVFNEAINESTQNRQKILHRIKTIKRKGKSKLNHCASQNKIVFINPLKLSLKRDQSEMKSRELKYTSNNNIDFIYQSSAQKMCTSPNGLYENDIVERYKNILKNKQNFKINNLEKEKNSNLFSIRRINLPISCSTRTINTFSSNKNNAKCNLQLDNNIFQNFKIKNFFAENTQKSSIRNNTLNIKVKNSDLLEVKNGSILNLIEEYIIPKFAKV